MITRIQAGISEIFSSLQGEGTHMGERHIFLRFENCNIHCGYCDELGKPGTKFDLGEAVSTISKLENEFGPHSYVSLTGGEPLLYHTFLSELCPLLKESGFRLYLETNGILWQALEKTIRWMDVIAMDLKPASVTHEKSFVEDHRKFLQIAKTKEAFIKIILSREIVDDEFLELCAVVREVYPAAPVILQPISTDQCEGHEDPVLMQKLMELQRAGRQMELDVRILPRLHRILKIR